MQALLECCCGIDIHKERVFACIITGKPDEESVIIEENFGTTRAQLQNMCQWLLKHNCYYVAMESTGVYWRPIYEACEEFLINFKCLMVVNAHHMRNLPGRKNDVKDAQWVATLFRHGLLEPSFVPERTIRNLREFSRLYRSFVKERVSYVNRLEKFLQAHGLKLSSVLSNIIGISGRRLLDLLVQNGQLTLLEVQSSISKRVRKSPEEISSAVSGFLDFAERLLLKTLLSKIDECDAQIAQLHQHMLEIAAPYRLQLEQLDSIPGIDVVAALAITAEISATPQEHFDSSKKLVSWAGLSPRNDESAGKVKSRKITKGNPYIKSILCQSAWSAVRVRKSPFHAWFWSHQGKLGKKKAIIAVARKILALCYKLLKSDGFYDPVVALRPIQSPS